MTILAFLLAAQGWAAGISPELQANIVLNNFHNAAAEADGPRYFGHFAQEGVFLGTDAGERWTVAQFKAYAQHHFSKGQGWTYRSKSRSVAISKDGETAWFDERLENDKYGTCRGSGVLVRRDGTWKIAQYNLSVPIPNALLGEFAAVIRERAQRAGSWDLAARDAAPIVKKRRGEPDFVILDVRTPGEFKDGRIDGAVNLDFHAGDFGERLALQDRGRTYLVHCAAGGRSAKVAERMKALGFRNVLHMKDGFEAWQTAGLPVER